MRTRMLMSAATMAALSGYDTSMSAANRGFTRHDDLQMPDGGAMVFASDGLGSSGAGSGHIDLGFREKTVMGMKRGRGSTFGARARTRAMAVNDDVIDLAGAGVLSQRPVGIERQLAC